MKRIIQFLLISLILVSIGIDISYARIAMPSENCHSFLGIQFRGTFIETQGKQAPLGLDGRGLLGRDYYYSNYEKDCTHADTKYYSLLALIFTVLSGLGYLGYKKYKARKPITQNNGSL